MEERDPGLPLKLWPCSNGEYVPPALDDLRREAMRRARVAADDHARRHGWSRRRFLLSSAGMASGLAILQSCSDEQRAATTTTDGPAPAPAGGTFTIPPTAVTDAEEATTTVHGGVGATPVVDVQTHFLDAAGFGSSFPQARCGEDDPMECFSVEYWHDLVFTQSDTAFAVISAVPVVGEVDGLSIAAMEQGRELANRLCGDERVKIQGHAVPDVGPLDAALASMGDIAAAHELAAWKVYTHAPTGWFLDDHDPTAPPIGGAFVDAARSSGVPVIAVHKGLSGGSRWASPEDIGPVAAANADLTFLVYHSGYETDVTEGPYDPDGRGVDRLIRTVADHGLEPGANVYAELGSTWRTVMGSPDEAAHLLGKLLVAFGPQRILWGTDSIWYGSPQDQIAAFRTFSITDAFQEQFGYPALTDEVKAQILGTNAVELFGFDPSISCAAAPAGLVRTDNRTFGPLSRRDIVSTFRREHPWMVPRTP